MSEYYTQFDNIFFEKTRLSMMTILFKEEKCSFNRLKDLMRLTDGALYTHLEKLIKEDYLEKKKELVGTQVQTIYFLTNKGKEVFKKYIQFLEEMILQNKSGGNE
ncbi:MAG: transcriptional regulator [Spirochaetales bacterium]|nr:transcriptional regulator [Spirochaetales bacterium]